MRGYSDSQPMIIAYINLEKRIPPDHPLRKIKPLADRELKRLSPLFKACGVRSLILIFFDFPRILSLNRQ